MSIKLGDWLKSINTTKEDLMVDEDSKKAFPAFIINRSLSYFPDTIFFANEMNRFPDLDSDLQYQFLRGAIQPKKRFSRWFKDDLTDKLNIIKEYYGYSNAKAKDIEHLIDDEDLKMMKKALDKGGRA